MSEPKKVFECTMRRFGEGSEVRWAVTLPNGYFIKSGIADAGNLDDSLATAWTDMKAAMGDCTFNLNFDMRKDSERK